MDFIRQVLLSMLDFLESALSTLAFLWTMMLRPKDLVIEITQVGEYSLCVLWYRTRPNIVGAGFASRRNASVIKAFMELQERLHFSMRPYTHEAPSQGSAASVFTSLAIRRASAELAERHALVEFFATRRSAPSIENEILPISFMDLVNTLGLEIRLVSLNKASTVVLAALIVRSRVFSISDRLVIGCGTSTESLSKAAQKAAEEALMLYLDRRDDLHLLPE